MSGSSPTLTLAIHPSEFPAETRASVLAGLRAGRIPGRFLYQSDAQAQRWLEYHQAFSPSRTDGGVRDLYRSAFAAAVAHVGGGPLVAVSLGCGGGQKDGDLLDAIAPTLRGRCAYVPLDTSPALVLEAALYVAARHPGVATQRLVANLEAEPDVAGWLGERVEDMSRLYGALGLLPNLEPLPLLAYLRRLLRRQDALLLSANQSPGGLAADRARILPQYDNPPARAWYLGAVESLGIAAGDVDLRVEAVPVEGDGWWRIAVGIVLRRDVTLRVFGESVAWRAGQAIGVFHSHRFTPAALRTKLAAAKLEVVADWQGAGGEEGVYLVCAQPEG
jgi:uncharacterized SAM-dependent methyltransferase